MLDAHVKATNQLRLVGHRNQLARGIVTLRTVRPGNIEPGGGSVVAKLALLGPMQPLSNGAHPRPPSMRQRAPRFATCPYILIAKNPRWLGRRNSRYSRPAPVENRCPASTRLGMLPQKPCGRKHHWGSTSSYPTRLNHCAPVGDTPVSYGWWTARGEMLPPVAGIACTPNGGQHGIDATAMGRGRAIRPQAHLDTWRCACVSVLMVVSARWRCALSTLGSKDVIRVAY